MTDRTEAEEHLRIIRTLMERATIYRAISAPTALVGGILALSVAGASLAWPSLLNFIIWWMLALLITASANTFFIARAAAQRGEPLISPSLKLAVSALFPPFLTAGVLTLMLGRMQNDYLLAVIWTIFYGLALLATRHFSPRSLIVLGWAFLAAGLIAWLIPFLRDLIRPAAANWLMGLTFGLFHIVYAAFTWPRKA